MSSPSFLAIKHWWRYQHYHTARGAPWIKLYASLLTDPQFIQMPEVAQAQLMKLWLLASQLGHPLPNNPRLLAGQIAVSGRFYLTTLIELGFLKPMATREECEQFASIASDSGKQDASESASKDIADVGDNASASRTRARGRAERGEKELEGRTELTPLSCADAESAVAERLTSDQHRLALTAVIRNARSRIACALALHAMLTGNDPAVPQPPSPEEFGQALYDWNANGGVFNAAAFRTYIVRAGKPRTRGAPPGRRDDDDRKLFDVEGETE